MFNMTISKDITGMVFGRLTVIKEAGRSRQGRKLWLCFCECGNSTVVRYDHLKSGSTISCGCYLRERITTSNYRHGDAKRGHRGREYEAWRSMLSRCYNKKRIDYGNYGGRGITVDRRWKDSYESFKEDMGSCPDGMSLDRIDNNGPYAPENCRWATRIEQMNNTRKSKHIELSGETHTLAIWSKITGFSSEKIWQRLRRGWEAEEALGKVPRDRRKQRVCL